jgi:thiol-disulfide isomerase/thioredoxin
MKCPPFILLTFLLLINGNSGKEKERSVSRATGGGGGGLILVTDDNWTQILEGEWMVEFFAPWCPACRNLQPVWEDFASWSNDLEIKVGQVDITNSPGLSGRFMITALPTIYHVIDGEFRQYKSPRTKDDFLSFVEEKKWERVDPIASWQSPASVQMSLLSQFYRVSMALRNVMNILTDEYGIPVWSAYLIFGGVTILIGLLLGLMLVFIIDCVYPQKRPSPPTTKPSSPSAKKDTKGEENPEDEIIDDEGSRPESGSGSGSEAGEDEENDEDNENEVEAEAEVKESRAAKESPDASGGARKRRARKD